MAAASASSLLSPPLIESIAAACPVDGAAAEAAVVPPLAALGLTLAALGLTSVALGLALADEADWLVAAAAMCVICKCVTCMVAVVCERECMCVCVCVCVVGGNVSLAHHKSRRCYTACRSKKCARGYWYDAKDTRNREKLHAQQSSSYVLVCGGCLHSRATVCVCVCVCWTVVVV
jgi:hypothetical protein